MPVSDSPLTVNEETFAGLFNAMPLYWNFPPSIVAHVLRYSTLSDSTDETPARVREPSPKSKIRLPSLTIVFAEVGPTIFKVSIDLKPLIKSLPPLY